MLLVRWRLLSAYLLFALLHLHSLCTAATAAAEDAGNELDLLMQRRDAAEADCIHALSNQPAIAAQQLAQAMRRGWWECTRRMVEASAAAGLDLRNEFELESRNIMREISALKAVIESSKPVQSIPTSFQWAQSGSEVFINAKFAHKLDAPATLDVAADNVTLTPTSLMLRASKDSKRFTLDLEFYDEIDPEASTWSFASVGRITFTLKKKGGPAAWPRLLKSKQKLANMHHWWEMAERYEDELEEIREQKDKQTKEQKKKAETKAAGAASDNDNGAATGNEQEASSTTAAATAPTPAPKKELTEAQKKIRAIEKDLKAAIQGLEEDLRSKKKQLEAEFRTDREVLEQTFEKTKARLEAEAEAKKKEILENESSQTTDEL